MPARKKSLATKRTAMRKKKAASCKRRITMILKTKTKRVANSDWNKLLTKVGCEYHTRHPSVKKWFGTAMKIASKVWQSRKSGETLQQMTDRASY